MGVDRVKQCIREVDVLMLASLFSFPCFPCFSTAAAAAVNGESERGRERKEISPLQRQSGRGQERGRINQPQSGLW